jgi:uncharacterized protein (TIGR02996 family)
MNQADAFLQAILEAPDDDTPRLVFADWLDDHDQPDRVEFIRVQIELARLPQYELSRRALGRREGFLLGKHGKTWAAGLAALVKEHHFRRGFVETASLKTADPEGARGCDCR